MIVALCTEKHRVISGMKTHKHHREGSRKAGVLDWGGGQGAHDATSAPLDDFPDEIYSSSPATCHLILSQFVAALPGSPHLKSRYTSLSLTSTDLVAPEE